MVMFSVPSKIQPVIAGLSLFVSGTNLSATLRAEAPPAGVSKDRPANDPTKESDHILRQFRVAELLFEASDAVSQYAKVASGENEGKNPNDVAKARTALHAAVDELAAECRGLSKPDKKLLAGEVAKVQRSLEQELDTIIEDSHKLRESLRNTTPKNVKKQYDQVSRLRSSLIECEATLFLVGRLSEALGDR